MPGRDIQDKSLEHCGLKNEIKFTIFTTVFTANTNK